jgi:hypothetical protein
MSPRARTIVMTLVLLGTIGGDAETIPGAEPSDAKRAFRESAPDQFQFDTGVVSGRVRSDGRTFGIDQLRHAPTGQPISGSYGLMSPYRVFSDGRRYGNAAWEWPSRAAVNDDGSLTIECAASEDRPFLLRGTYRWSGPATLELRIDVIPERPLRGFEVFLASYYDASFTHASAWVGEHPDTTGHSGFLAAERPLGDWLAFPRDPRGVELIQDGRWQLPPHPVSWVIQPTLARPLARRGTSPEGLTALTMASPDDCFAVLMPYQTETHYSIYLSLFGRDLPAGQVAGARARWQLLEHATDDRVRDAYRAFVQDEAVNLPGESP